MAGRAELALRAAAVGIDPSTITNDSVLEQRVLYYETHGDTITGALAVGTLTSDATAPADGDTVTIGSITYTFKTTLTGAAFEVLIGASAAVALDNLKDAINQGAIAGSEGTTYGAGTYAHPDVTATTNTNTTQVVQARNQQYGNSIATTETSAHLSWGGATLASGVAARVAPPAYAVAAVVGSGKPV